jgi:hypothetical protein
MPFWVGQPERPSLRRGLRLGAVAGVLFLVSAWFCFPLRPAKQAERPAVPPVELEDANSGVTEPRSARTVRPLVVVMRDLSMGVTVRPGRIKDTPELVVDAFPDKPGEGASTEERRR